MYTFALVALVATAAAEAVNYGAPVISAFAPTLAARDDCPKPTSACTGVYTKDGVSTTLTYSCINQSQRTTHVTVTQTTTVTATPGADAPPAAKGPPADDVASTTTVKSTQYKTTTVTKTVQRASSSSYVPSASSGLPLKNNGTASGYASPTLHNKQPTATLTPFTGAAGQTSVSIAALFLGLVAAAQFI